jgi:hypothetical protein
MPPRPAVLFALSAAFAWAGCDSEGAPPTGQTPAAEVRLVQPLPDLTLEAGESPTSVDLAVHFTANAEAGSLSFVPTVVGDGGLTVEVAGSRLSLRAPAVGDVAVRVEARGARGGVAVDTFEVRVSRACPAGPAEGVAFPVETGRRWVFGIETYWKPTSNPGRRSSGRAEVDVMSATTCSGGTRQLEVRERRTELFERERYVQASNDVEWVADEDSTVTEQVYTWTVRDSTVTTDAPDIQGQGAFGPPPFGREAPRFWDGETTQVGQYSGFGPFVTLTRAVGPTRYYVTPLYGTAGQAYEEWTYAGD